MNIILMIVAVALVYFFVVTLYRKNWSKNLKMNLNFESRNVIRGDSTNLVLTVSNAKKLPLAMINTKFQLDKSLYFTDIDTNSTTTDRTYRNDVFSLGPNQKITRRIPIKCLKRGVFTLDNLEIVFNGVFMDEVNVCKQDATAFITVYPQAIDVNKLGIINNSLEGDLTKKKHSGCRNPGTSLRSGVAYSGAARPRRHRGFPSRARKACFRPAGSRFRQSSSAR